MHPLLIYIGSGWIFWGGVISLLVSCLSGIGAGKGWRLHLAQTAAVLGILQIALSSTPVPGWLWWLLLLATAGTMAALQFRYGKRRIVQGVFGAVILAAAVFELPYWLDGEPVAVRGRVRILADSISSGIGFAGERVWSVLLDEERPGRIENRAVPGSRVSTSRRTLEQFRFCPGDVLVIELGGNDLLGGVPGAEFRRKLDGLLGVAASFDVPVLMFELPLPPFRSSYLRAQREMAAKYGVTLIPRRRFAAVLSGGGSTVDGLHLSNYGHGKMAAVVRRCLLFD